MATPRKKSISAIPRKFLWGAMLVLIVIIYALYNFPGANNNLGKLKQTTTEAEAISSENNTKSTTDTSPLNSISNLSKDYSSPFKPFNIQHWVNQHGARVYFVNAPEIPMMDVRLIFDAGAARDGNAAGLAGMVNGMLEQGSENYSVDEIATTFESLGASFSASSHRDMAVIQLRSLSEEQWLKPALDLLTEIVAKPAFPQADFERVRDLALLGLKYKEQSPAAKIGDALFTSLYANHNYGILPDGTPSSLGKMNVDQLRKFHQRYYVSNNLVIAMVGNIDKAHAKRIADQITLPLLAGNMAGAIPTPEPPSGEQRVHLEHASAQTHIRLASHGIKRGAPDYFALYIGNEILGGGGFSSLLNEEIRQKRGLAYSIYSYFSPMRTSGPFVVGLQTKTESTDEALDVINSTMSKFLRDGPSDDQVLEAKRGIINSFPLRIASNSQIVGQLGAIGFYNLPLNYLDNYLEEIRSISAEDIKMAMNRHLSTDKLLTITVGKKALNLK